ncbi:hypothetical protein NPIL_132261 [Nephila pilipes]|uniref:Uncharacterized protein n=1 Tax=Nephila pilipes TaxID=299642 RepID=A0A8X6PDT6_NEPPI|nr:hypothetical protein NPIL_132261 [Nephila pilipes]
MKGKAPQTYFSRVRHDPRSQEADRTIDLKRPDRRSQIQKSGHRSQTSRSPTADPDLRGPTTDFKTQRVISCFGRRFLLRLGKKPVPKFFPPPRDGGL